MTKFCSVVPTNDINVVKNIINQILNDESDPERTRLMLVEDKENRKNIKCAYYGCKFNILYTIKKNAAFWKCLKYIKEHTHQLNKNYFKNTTETDYFQSTSSNRKNTTNNNNGNTILIEKTSNKQKEFEDIPLLIDCKKKIIKANGNGYCGFNCITLYKYGNEYIYNRTKVINKMIQQLESNLQIYMDLK